MQCLSCKNKIFYNLRSKNRIGEIDSTDVFDTKTFYFDIPKRNPIFVPFSREEQQHGSGFYVCLRTGPAGKIAFSSRNVNQLIFVEGAFAFVLEIVVIRVFRQRVGMIRKRKNRML